MPVDYSKWDALELSDDSDIEVHPNVDKRSFIRAKQSQIHQERAQRKHEAETLKYERVINDGLLTRIDALISCLKRHAADAASARENDPDTKGPSDDELVFQSLLESGASGGGEDTPPAPPAGVHSQAGDRPSYSKMMAALVDQVKRTVDEEKKPAPTQRLNAFVAEVGEHKAKVLELQQKLLARLAEIAKLDGAKITSENIRTGFDSSSVAKSTPAASSKAKPKSAGVELLNPGATGNVELDSGSEADTEGGEADPDLPSPLTDRSIHPTKLGLAFAQLPRDDYNSYLRFIAQNPEVLLERETDGLLMRAFDLQYAGKDTESRQAVHQALLLQYCRQLGRDGVALFFKRVTTRDSDARKMFITDVNDTYGKLRVRASEMASEVGVRDGSGGGEGGGDIEQIQLHAMNPGEKIQIGVPGTGPDEKDARAIYESLPPNLQKALATGELDEVNVVLGRMPVSEAEEVVEKLSQGGMLSLEQGVVDATTEEGREFVRQLEKGDGSGQPGGTIEEVDEVEEGVKAVDVVD